VQQRNQRRRDREKASRRVSRELRNRLTKVDGFVEAPARVRPSYVPVYQAFIDCIDAGQSATTVNLAKKLGITKQAVSKFLRKHPDVLAFVDRHVRRVNGHQFGLVMRRHYNLAQQGSVDSAEFVAKVESGHYAPRAPLGFGEGDDDPANASQYHYTLNLLVPRPDYPQLPPATPTAPVPLADIPVLEVR
jgi:hypothetical protein